jgi:hypothetical protein
MAVVKIKKKKKDLSAKTEPMDLPLLSAKTGPIGGPIPSANIMGAQPVPTAESMSQQIDTMEMRKQGSQPASSTVVQTVQPVKVKKKKQAGMKAAEPSEPMSPQTWANIGNNPSDYPAYLEAFKKQKK